MIHRPANVDHAVAALHQMAGGGYDAVKDKGKRQPSRSRLEAEDQLLADRDRRRLVATSRDVRRNFAILAWMVRKHLDYVASHTFQASTPDDGLNRELEAFMVEYADKDNCDVARRHRLSRMIRMAEGLRCIDGDMFFYKLKTGQLQGLEGDRVRNTRIGVPSNLDIERFKHGVRTNDAGEALSYMVTNRTGRGGFAYHAVVPARHMIGHGFFDRFDQVRGISPIAAALNTLQDVYEGFDYALARAKVSQLFALAIYSAGETDDSDIAQEEAVDDESGRYKVDFGRGPLKLEFEPGDKAEFLESQQPSTQFREFTNICIAVALKALDIPFSFFDESFTNFFGSRGGVMQYLKACKAKREDVQELLDAISWWRLSMAVEDGELRLPRGMSVDDLAWQWVPDGVPWWDPAKEVRGHAMAVAAGFDTFEHVVRESGGGTGNIYDNIRANAKVVQFARDNDFPLVLPGVNAFNPEPVAGSNDSNDQERGS